MGVAFFTDALTANSSKPDLENVRMIIMAKVRFLGMHIP